MTKIFLAILIISKLNAEVGYICEMDLNGDSVCDKIMSGPHEFFGQSGGPFVVYLSGQNKSVKTIIIDGSPDFIALDKGKKSRLYTFGRCGDIGGITQLELFGEYKESTIMIDPTENASEIDDGIFKTIFNKKNLLKFNKIENYVPPPNPTGKPWGN